MKLYKLYLEATKKSKFQKVKDFIKIGAGIKKEPDRTMKDVDDEALFLKAKYNQWSKMGKFMGRPKF